MKYKLVIVHFQERVEGYQELLEMLLEDQSNKVRS